MAAFAGLCVDLERVADGAALAQASDEAGGEELGQVALGGGVGHASEGLIVGAIKGRGDGEVEEKGGVAFGEAAG